MVEQLELSIKNLCWRSCAFNVIKVYCQSKNHRENLQCNYPISTSLETTCFSAGNILNTKITYVLVNTTQETTPDSSKIIESRMIQGSRSIFSTISMRHTLSALKEHVSENTRISRTLNGITCSHNATHFQSTNGRWYIASTTNRNIAFIMQSNSS